MKHYLELIPISARVHRKQSRITRICIILAVFLVTAIFSMADMEIRSQYFQAIQSDGNWHVMFKGLNTEQAAVIAARPEVIAASWYDVLNYRLDENYEVAGNRVAVCGFEEDFYKLMPSAEPVEGKSFNALAEAVLTMNAKEKLGVQVGNKVRLQLPDGSEQELTVSGFTKNTGMIMKEDAVGIFVSMETLGLLDVHRTPVENAYYVQLSSKCNIPEKISEIETAFGLSKEQVGRNEKLLGIMGMSRDSYIMQLYGTAAVLAVLVITAGTLMIASNLNSNIAKRTEFFGMLRCQGATKKQIKSFVRLEALNWCRTAVPIGVIGGIFISCVLCNMLRILSPGYFAGMPVFGISTIGIVSGIVIGVLTVLLAASAPAKRAAVVSPLTAVSGNSYQTEAIHKGARVSLLPVETALGIHHAWGSRKNFWLMTGSFAFSMILFLAFTTAVDFLGHALRPLKPYTPDLSVISPDNTCSIPKELLQEISQESGVKRIYGRMFAYHLPASAEGNQLMVNLISYEDIQFQWAEEALTEGSLETVQDGTAVLTVYDMNNPLRLGDELQIDLSSTSKAAEEAVGKGTVEEAVGGTECVQIAGVLSECPFSREDGIETIICSEETFRQLTGEIGYTILDIQLNKKVTDENVAAIRQLAGTDVIFSDQRINNRDVKGGFYSMALFIYGFLVIIALISAFHIINSIAMSVSARLGQYGAMRAIGMSDRQVIRMVAAESLTYAVSGIALGTVIGLPMHKALYERMITFHWGDVWTLPVKALLLITLTVGIATALSIYGPAKRIREMTIVDTIRGE